MNIKQKRENKKVTVYVSGRLDTNTSPKFLDYLKEAMVGTEELIIDLKEVDYISSAGLRVILLAQKTMSAQGSMSVANVQEDVMEVFELTGFTDILTII